MARLRLIPPSEADLRHIARHLRAGDMRELQATRGDDFDVVACLLASVAGSEVAHVAVTPYGEPIAVFGLAPISLLGGQGCPWMLGTETLNLYGRDVVLMGKHFARQWGQRYDTLFNYVDARNLRAVAWLRHSGYTLFKAEPRGVQGEPFHRFERCA